MRTEFGHPLLEGDNYKCGSPAATQFQISDSNLQVLRLRLITATETSLEKIVDAAERASVIETKQTAESCLGLLVNQVIHE